MDTYVINGVCRCCASQGSSKDIDTSYTWMGGEEIYSKMLRDCFDIALSRSVSGHDGGICELCVTQLRNAYNFKKQVVSTEEMLKKRLNSDQFKPSLVKVELEVHPERISDSDNDMGDHMDQDSGDDHSTKEFLVPIKSEVQEAPEVKPKRRATKAGTSAAKKPKLEAETSKSKAPRATKTQRKIPARTTLKAGQASCSRGIVRERLLETDPNCTELDKQYNNMSAILKFSNATPFRGRNALGYVCAYCRNTFPDPGNLRRHTHDDHAKHLLAYISVKNLDKLDIYLDTTDLKCTICDARLTKDCGDDLKGFGEHLAGAHGEKFYTEIGDFIYPFKLTTDALMKCCLCAASYSTMKALLEHMNDTHFKNFICPLCGCGFINRQKLKLHEASQHNSKKCFVCPHCEENFDTPWRKRVHVNSVHRGGVGRNVCRICQATFKECYQKHRHMVEAHNHPPLKCEECDKVFYLKSRLLLHHRQTHAKERPFECDICKRGFFDKIRLKEHLVVHTREKKFSCELCGKTYVRIKNLKSHLKSHF